MEATLGRSSAVVSGGTRGIGLALCRRLISLGYSVTALYRGDSQAAAAAVAEFGDGFAAEQVDVADAAAVQAAAERILDARGAPRVLVNNAAINIDRPFLEMTYQEWRAVIDVNLTGAFNLCRAFAAAMMTVADATIVNVGATTGMRPRRDGANYCASKAGLHQLTKCLALELAPQVRVNCLIPGMTETDEVVTRFGLTDPAKREAALRQIPQGRIGRPDDIADALEFLTGPHAAYLTGQQIIVDGGRYMG